MFLRCFLSVSIGFLDVFSNVSSWVFLSVSSVVELAFV